VKRVESLVQALDTGTPYQMAEKCEPPQSSLPRAK